MHFGVPYLNSIVDIGYCFSVAWCPNVTAQCTICTIIHIDLMHSRRFPFKWIQQPRILRWVGCFGSWNLPHLQPIPPALQEESPWSLIDFQYLPMELQYHMSGETFWATCSGGGSTGLTILGYIEFMVIICDYNYTYRWLHTTSYI